jgi:hypothetical protein
MGAAPADQSSAGRSGRVSCLRPRAADEVMNMRRAYPRPGGAARDDRRDLVGARRARPGQGLTGLDIAECCADTCAERWP